MSNYFQRRFQMKTPLPTDLFNLKCQFESWRKTRTKRTRTPDHLLKAAADLLDQYPVSTICRVCRINPRTLRQWNITSKTTSKIQALPDTLKQSEQRNTRRSYFVVLIKGWPVK